MMMAMLAPLGIQQGKPFAPGDRETKILTDGALMGELMSMNISFAKRFPNSYYRRRQMGLRHHVRPLARKSPTTLS